MKCAGSISFIDLPEYESGVPAQEGTAAGELLQAMLEQRNLAPVVGTHAKNGFPFDADMKFHVTPIAEDILTRASGGVLCETEVTIYSTNAVVKGHSDANFVSDGKLYVDDLKYGWKIVEVKENWQLLAYAIGEVIRRQQVFDTIVLRIHQPRQHHEDGSTRTWELSYNELMSYYDKLLARLEVLASGSKELVTGPHCKYCPAAGHACPAFNRAYHSALDYVMSDFKQDDITEETLAFQLNQLDRANDILKIKKDSLSDLANYRIKGGSIIPGWMSQESFGHRKWKPGVTPEVIKMLTGKNIIKEEMLSPAQAEKLGVPKDLVKNYSESYFAGMKLVKGDSGKLADKIFNNKEKS